jgi:hypothetical protein
MAREANLKNAEIISKQDMEKRYFSGRTDNFFPAEGEIFLLATI